MKLRPLLWQVTMFTIAHTITLGLAMNGILDLPARIVPAEVFAVTVLALALAVSSTIYPAVRGARTEPASALRND